MKIPSDCPKKEGSVENCDECHRYMDDCDGDQAQWDKEAEAKDEEAKI